MYELRSGSRRDGGQSDLSTRKGAIAEPLKIIYFKRTLTRAILLQLSESYIYRNRNKFNRSDKRKKTLQATHKQSNKSDATCTQSSSSSLVYSILFF